MAAAPQPPAPSSGASASTALILESARIPRLRAGAAQSATRIWDPECGSAIDRRRDRSLSRTAPSPARTATLWPRARGLPGWRCAPPRAPRLAPGRRLPRARPARACVPVRANAHTRALRPRPPAQIITFGPLPPIPSQSRHQLSPSPPTIAKSISPLPFQIFWGGLEPQAFRRPMESLNVSTARPSTSRNRMKTMQVRESIALEKRARTKFSTALERVRTNSRKSNKYH